MDRLKDLIRERLGDDSVSAGSEVVATVTAPRDLETHAEAIIADVLATRLREAALSKYRSSVTGVGTMQVDSSDHATCRDISGEEINAFTSGQLCYRVRASVVTGEWDYKTQIQGVAGQLQTAIGDSRRPLATLRDVFMRQAHFHNNIETPELAQLSGLDEADVRTIVREHRQ